MKMYLFLMAWIDGSETAEDLGESTEVNEQDDLLPQFKLGNENVFARLIYAPNEEIAAAFGYKEALFQDYTAYNSVSDCKEISGFDELGGMNCVVIKVSTKEEE